MVNAGLEVLGKFITILNSNELTKEEFKMIISTLEYYYKNEKRKFRGEDTNNKKSTQLDTGGENSDDSKFSFGEVRRKESDGEGS